MKQLILRYFDHVQNKLSRQLKNDSLPEELRKDVEGKLVFVESLAERVQFQLKQPEDKQAVRIEWIAVMRKRELNVKKQLATLSLYSKIRDTLPFIKVMNVQGTYSGLMEICKKELEIIDFSGMAFGSDHVDLQAVEKEFVRFKELEEEKNPLQHPEAFQKINELFLEFKNVFE